MDKFLGVGLKNAMGIALVTIIVIVAVKAIFAQWHVPGVSEFVHAV